MTETSATQVNVQGPVPKIEVRCRSWFADANEAGPATVWWVFFFAGFALAIGLLTGVAATDILRLISRQIWSLAQ